MPWQRGERAAFSRPAELDSHGGFARLRKNHDGCQISALPERREKKESLVGQRGYLPTRSDRTIKNLGESLHIDVFSSSPEQTPSAIADAALMHASKQFYDVLIVDTAGRLHIDDAMMQELAQLKNNCSPPKRCLLSTVWQARRGEHGTHLQRAGHAHRRSSHKKRRRRARRGRAFGASCHGKPIKFIGTVKKTDALQRFYADRIASRILGMGDVLSLVEDIERKVDQKKAEKIAEKIKKGKRI